MLMFDNFIEVLVDNGIMEAARRRNRYYYQKFGDKGTFRKDKSRQRMTGYLAEAAIKRVFPILEYSKKHYVDFIYKGYTFDSKASGGNAMPRKHYVATIYENQKKRKVDWYIFCRVKNDFSKVWILGSIHKEEFFEKATLQTENKEGNDVVYEEPRYVIKYENLHDLDLVVHMIQRGYFETKIPAPRM